MIPSLQSVMEVVEDVKIIGADHQNQALFLI